MKLLFKAVYNENPQAFNDIFNEAVKCKIMNKINKKKKKMLGEGMVKNAFIDRVEEVKEELFNEVDIEVLIDMAKKCNIWDKWKDNYDEDMNDFLYDLANCLVKKEWEEMAEKDKAIEEGK